MNNNNIQQTTFWAFLQKHNIEIPIIQRDYAQGRIGKEKLREIFLKDLKDALDDKLPKDEKKLKLDFVYGSVIKDRLNPLDGQQRLTTLWLLHWYIAYKAEKLSEENINFFKNFSYETRISSREFCIKLSDFKLNSAGSIVHLIQNQTWFFSVWKQDPTIQAMLNMLGGTPIKDKEGKEIYDGIDEVFGHCQKDAFKAYWERLIGESCPIVFYYLDLFELKLSDDLYIKMNARGKSLTNFENFKADLVGFIKETNWEDKWKEERINARLTKEDFDKKEISKEEANPNKTISHKLDTDWTNIFWINKSNDHKIDDIYFTFFNRYFLNELITAKKPEKDFLYTQEQIESNELFKYLYGKSGDDSNVKYYSFDVYKSEKEVFTDTLFDRFNKTLDNLHNAFKNISKEEINKLFMPEWDDKSSFHFIPEYVKKEGGEIPTQLTQPQRVVFYAICSYFENNTFDEAALRKWIRVVWNIVENANINSIQSMISAMRLIDELKSSANKIYKFLADTSTVIKSEVAKEQVAEEIEKAKQIVNDLSNNWESKIIEAEKTAFFKGSIRFLFRTNINSYDWDKFEERFEKAKMYFDINGVNYIYKNDSILLRALISFFTEWGQFWEIVYDNSQTSWKTTLIDKKWISPVAKLLDQELPIVVGCTLEPIETFNDSQKLLHKDLVCSTLLSNIVEGCRLNCRHEKHALYPPYANANWKKYVIGNTRNQLLFDLRNADLISTDQNISGLPFFWGWELYFSSKINNKRYKWEYALEVQIESDKWEIVKDVNLDNLKSFLKNVEKNPINKFGE